MRRIIVPWALACALLILFSGLSGAQTAVSPSPTLIVTGTPALPTYTPPPTHTPYPTAATPGPTATPTFLQLTEKQIPWWLAGLVGLVGVVLGFMLKPVFERLGSAIAEGLSRLGSGWGFKKRYLIHLIEEYQGLNIRGLKTRAPVTLELRWTAG